MSFDLLAVDHPTTDREREGDRVERGTGRDSQPLRASRSVRGMDSKDGIREFLASRRAKVTPEQAGLPVYGTNRRVTGLRREEVAMLAGISVEYYTRLERGNTSGVSDDVLEGIARALQLDEAERAHLFHLVRAATTTGAPRRRAEPGTGPSDRPTDPRLDRRAGLRAQRPPRHPRRQPARRSPVLAGVRLPDAAGQHRPVHVPRPERAEFFVDWDSIAHDAVAILRAAAGRDPYDRRLTDLIGELSTRSDEFRVRWAAHNVKFHRTGTKRLHHPVVGDVTLNFEAFELAADPGQRLNVYTAEPGSPSHDALNLLASWITTPTDVTTGGDS